MISVGARDARKGLGLGFGGVGASPRRDMEDTELEEGEAYSFHNNHNNDDDDASIDPDIALSYIDEKLQDVLGHFQKDFEGGVSAENLGAKFGGYGSFLPTYQRSPAWSQRTPPKVQSYSASRSPNILHLAGGHCNSVVSSTAPQSGGRGPASTSSTSLPAVKTSSVNESAKKVIMVPENYVEESAPRYESKNKKHPNASDQKTLKVRIKVGPDNLATRKNAAIYSGLGLDDSPSSSLDDSPSESEGLSQERREIPFESPNSILQIMTCFPVRGGLLLSPLHDDLINLMEKEKLPKDCRSVPHPRGSMETGGIMNGADTKKSDAKIGENTKTVEKNDHSAESKSGNDKDARMRDVSRKEPELDALACEELVSNTLKLPILSNSYSTTSDMKKSREVNKSTLKDNVLSERGEEKQMESTSFQEDGWVDKRKSSFVGKVSIEGKESSINEISVHPNKDGQQKGEKMSESGKSDSNVAKSRKVSSTEGLDSLKQKTNKKVTSHDQEISRLPLGKENPIPGEKKKSKGSQGTATAEAPKDSVKIGSSMPKTKKSTLENCMSNSDVDHGKSRRDAGKTMDTYRDFFGEMEEEDPMDLLGTPADKMKESDVPAKSKSAVTSAAKDRPTAKKFDKPSMSEAVPLPVLTPPSGNGPVSDAAPPAAAPVLIEEHWVGCDKCQKWRLLPIGINPDHLPEKWSCSMLNWLPGMNRCSFTEEETNNALMALYQAPPVPESQTNLHNNPGGHFNGATVTNVRKPDQIQRNYSGKKKNGLKVMSNAVNKESPPQLSNSMKKNAQSSAKSRSLNDVNSSPLVNEPDSHLLNKCSNLSQENQRQKYKEKNKADTSLGESKTIKSRGDLDHDSSRASKKLKIEAKNIIDEGWASDHSGAVGKVGPSSSGGFPTSSAGKDRAKYSERSFSKDSKLDVKGRVQGSLSKVKLKDEVYMDNGSLDTGNAETKDTIKKRKIKEVQNGSHSGKDHHLPDMPFVKEEFSDNDYRREKKPKISRSEEKASSASKGNSRTDKRRSHSKNQIRTQDLCSTQQNMDGLDFSKKDLTSKHSLAATSSSSKVSGSHKTKSSFQELKGSPVESVSSSPMRISNPDKFSSVDRDASMKDEFQHAGNYALRSPKRSFDGDELGQIDHYRALRTDNHQSDTAHGIEFLPQEFAHPSSSKARRSTAPSPDLANHHCTNGALVVPGQETQLTGKTVAPGFFGDEEKQNENHYHANGSQPRKSGKGSSSRLDKSRSFKSEADAVKVRGSDISEMHDLSASGEVKTRDGKKKLQDKLAMKSDEIEEKVTCRKDNTGKQLNDACKRENRLNTGGADGVDTKVGPTCRKDAMSTPNHNSLPESNNDERTSKRVVLGKLDQMDTIVSGEKSMLLPPSGLPPTDALNRSQLGTGSHKGNGGDVSQVGISNGDNAQKVQKQMRKADNQSRSQQIGSRHPSKNGHKARDVDVPSPIRRDPSSHAASNALKEAKDLKHMADRLNSAGSSHERTGLYFQAALKFLHGASLLESGSSENINHNDIIRSRQTYSETAKLCTFCAYEYEKAKDMATAALAYKCTEVAYMRVIYSSHASASRDRHELQTSMIVVPHGESPSSSASDVDNLNNLTTADKIALPRGVGSPQVAANQVLTARVRPNLFRLLNFANDVHLAMEASRKSWDAFAAANGNTAEMKGGEGILSIKRALEFNFQDVDGLLRLVRLAMELIGR